MKKFKIAFKTILATLLSMQLLFALPIYAATYKTNENQHPHRFWNSKDPDPMVMAIDGLLVRPVSLVATMLGSVFYVVTWPFSAAGGNSGQAWDQMVKAPARATFDRPLGVFYVDFDKETPDQKAYSTLPLPAVSEPGSPAGDLSEGNITEESIETE